VGQVRVVIQAADPLTLTGLTTSLRGHPEIVLLKPEQRLEADVAVLAADRLTAEVVAGLRRTSAMSRIPVVLITTEITEAELLIALDCRVVGVVPRLMATPDRLAYSVVAAAAGGGVMPPNLVGELLKHIERLQREVLAPNGLSASGPTSREIDVLRLMADGMDTAEIADQLRYSERTVKNVIYGVTHRLNLRNRSHAVAYALRTGLI
jgi:DNA-binding NarL/FixJ family response regulator